MHAPSAAASAPPAPPDPPLVGHDVREGGRWTPAQALKNHLLYMAVSCLLFALRPFPRRWLRSLGRRLGCLIYTLAPATRRVALENLARVYPALPPADLASLALRAYGQLGEYLGDAVAELHGAGAGASPPLPFEAGSREVLDAARRGSSSRGVLFVSAHLGPWERVAASLVAHGFPLTTVARESYDPRFAALYDRLRGGAGVRAIYRGSPSAALQIVRTLRQGQSLLGVPMDLRSRVASVDVPFLGTPASTPVGPARIALRTGAAVVVGTVFPGTAGLLLRVTQVETDGLDEVELTRRLNDELSRRILAFPEGWVWMHPRWAAPVPENSAPFSKESR